MSKPTTKRPPSTRKRMILMLVAALVIFGGVFGIKAMIGERPIVIEIDGGVTPETAPLVARAGADILVAGSAVFKGGAQAYAGNIAALRHAADTTTRLLVQNEG